MAQQQNQGGARGEDDRGMAQQQRKQDESAQMPGREQEDRQEPMGDLGIGRDIGREDEVSEGGGSIGTPGTAGTVDERDLSDAEIRGRRGEEIESEAELGLSEEEDVLGEAGLTDELGTEEDDDLGTPL